MDKRDVIAEVDPDMLFLTESVFDAALLGYVTGYDVEPRALYDVSAVIRVLMGYGMTEEEAWEYFDFNVLGAYVGSRMPLFMYPFEENEESSS